MEPNYATKTLDPNQFYLEQLDPIGDGEAAGMSEREELQWWIELLTCMSGKPGWWPNEMAESIITEIRNRSGAIWCDPSGCRENFAD